MPIFDTTPDDLINSERINQIPGLSYYKDFITRDEEEYLLAYISNIEYTKEFGRDIKYYGFPYSYKKSMVDIRDFKYPIPEPLNIIYNKLGVDLNQLLIEHLPINKFYTFPIHSNIFSNNIMTISLGGNCVIKFQNKISNKEFEILVKRRSLLLISDECRKEWSYTINTNKSHMFNHRKVKRNNRYTLTYKNIKIIS